MSRRLSKNFIGPLLIAAWAFAGCMSSPVFGPLRMDTVRLRSAANRGVFMPYSVYLPPGFSAHEELPLVVFLHGGGDDEQAFDRHGLALMLDDATNDGRIPRAVVVVPRGDLGFWADWYDRSRNYASWVLREVMPDAKQRFHTKACPNDCHLMGVSMGADGAMRMFLRNPQTFASLTSLSGPSLNGERRRAFAEDRLIAAIIPVHRIFGPTSRFSSELDDPFVRFQRASDAPNRLFIGYATNDRTAIREGTDALHEHLEARSIEHRMEVFQGGHNWVSWNPVILQALAHALSSNP